MQRTPEPEITPPVYLADVRDLCVEFQRAIAALASNDLQTLEAGIAAQEQLAGQLQNWFRGIPPPRSDNEEAAIRINTGEFRELVNLTRVYSALLQRSMRSVRLRMALCRTYQQIIPNASNEFTAATTLSCEV